jgi:peptide/nickel transport system permease protein
MKKKNHPERAGEMSTAADIWYRLRKNKAAMVGLTVIIIIILLAVFANLFADYNNDVIMTHADSRLQTPSAEHWFGTDAGGRDIFARVIYGARYSLVFGLGCTFIAMIIGGILGASAAYFGGKVDEIITFIVDAIICIPSILLSLSLVAVLGAGFTNLMIAITISSVPSFARVIRSIVLGVTGQEYIEAAKAVGVSNTRIIFVHVLPNAIALIIVNATMNIAGLIIAASSLSFIGMGIQPPAPEWGAMLTDALQYLRTAPHVAIFPGLAILITALSFNLLGDGLSEALDPRMRG